jgi:pantoate--beta-alanine ligase
MILFKKTESLTLHVLGQKRSGKKVGFVPTMGALHQGHLSLIQASKEENDITVCSVFVNPRQFNNPEDFRLYPVSIETDMEKLLVTGCDILLMPSTDEIYPPNYKAKSYNLGTLETVLEGHYRPGHFQGVCQVVDRLLEVTQPDNLYLGAKDFQQCKVIAKLIELLGKQAEISLKIEPTLREADGLAMSSRNLRLKPEERTTASTIFKALRFVKENHERDSLPEVKDKATDMLKAKGFKVDYFEIADAETLLPASRQTKDKIALVAAFIDNVRLIDNMLLN